MLEIQKSQAIALAVGLEKSEFRKMEPRSGCRSLATAMTKGRHESVFDAGETQRDCFSGDGQ
jgi:hypothetical protein